MMVLAFADLLGPGWVFLVAGLNGIFRPNDLVMRNSLIGETIPSPHLMGAVGLPEFDNAPPEKRPEKGLLGIRQVLGVYANLRPARGDGLPGSARG